MKKFVGLLLLSLIVFTFSSCKKHVENKIEGDWRETNVINPYSDELIDWKISGGNFDIIQSFTDNTNIFQLASGTYVIKIKPFKKIFSVTSCTDSVHYKADWKITKLTNKFLSISISKNTLPVTYYEFTKQ
jgi:hypothetical protein